MEAYSRKLVEEIEEALAEGASKAKVRKALAVYRPQLPADKVDFYLQIATAQMRLTRRRHPRLNRVATKDFKAWSKEYSR